MTFREIITAESIFPCLDTFDVVLMRSTDSQPSKERHWSKVKTSNRPFSEPHHHRNQTRQLVRQFKAHAIVHLVRLYSCTEKVYLQIVDRIASASTQHFGSTDRLYPSANSHYGGGHYNSRVRGHKHRPSMLVELRQLNYVREYALPVKSQLVRMQCDTFEPSESIYYCFIYVILYQNAIFFESLPYCVPTTLNRDQQPASGNPEYSGIMAINKKPAIDSGLIDTPTFDGPVTYMGNVGKTDNSTRKYLKENEQMYSEHERMDKMKTVRAHEKQRHELDEIRSMILPLGPAYEKANPLSEKGYTDSVSETDDHLMVDSNEKDANIRQFALKSAEHSEYDTEQRRSAARASHRKKVLIQTRSCFCAGQSNGHSVGNIETPSLKQSLVRINLTASETTVLHLILTSCPTPVDELAVDESAEEYTNYHSTEDHNETMHNARKNFSDVPLIEAYQLKGTLFNFPKPDITIVNGTDRQMSDKKLLVSHTKSGKPMKNRKGKGKKGSGVMKKREASQELPGDTEGLPRKGSEASGTTPSPSAEDASPTVCILSVDNSYEYEYSFQLDSIDPSIEWPLSEMHTFDGIDFSSTIDLAGYLHRFPFLIVRNGHSRIDPQMNLDNPTQMHLLRSKHLRFESLSSINITIRFRRSALARPRVARQPVGEVASPGSWSEILGNVRSLVDRTVSFIAYKVVNSESQEDNSLAQLTAFHITSMLLSLFILATLLIFAAIALLTRPANSTQYQVVQIRTPEEMNETYAMEANSPDCSPLAATNGSSQNSCQTDEPPNNSQGVSKRHDSLLSFSLEQQSLEMDYYDYAVPLMVHSPSASFGTVAGDTTCNEPSTDIPFRPSFNPPEFRTLPIKVNSPSRKICSTANTSMCSLSAINGATQSLSKPLAANRMINDAQSTVGHQPALATVNISTLTRLSFSKPPVLLSTFGRAE